MLCHRLPEQRAADSTFMTEFANRSGSRDQHHPSLAYSLRVSLVGRTLQWSLAIVLLDMSSYITRGIGVNYA
jgi:hypothetical protein